MDDAFVQAGKTYTFGGRHSRSGFRITGPFGAETIKAVASTNLLDSLLASDKKTEDSEPYLSNFHTQMRGASRSFQIQASKRALEQSQLLSTARGRK